MEREVSDTEGIFSRKRSNNWAELPTTLRRRQKHRPEILSQFTENSESSEIELRRIEAKPFSYEHGLMQRSDFSFRHFRRDRRSPSDDRSSHVEEDYRKNYENYDAKVSQKRESFRDYASPFDRDFRSFSDEERKTNSPDSLLVKSSESETSSDEYGHTDDSGAFLEKASAFERVPRPKCGPSAIDNAAQNRLVRFFSRSTKSSDEDLPSKPRASRQEATRVAEESSKTAHASLLLGRDFPPKMHKNERNSPTRAKDAIQQRFDYENIPRIDVTKLDAKPFLNPLSQISASRGENRATSETSRQINTKNNNNSSNYDNNNGGSYDFYNNKQSGYNYNRENANRNSSSGNRSSPPNGQGEIVESAKKSGKIEYENVMRNQGRESKRSPVDKQTSIEELRLEGLIQDFYNSEQLAGKSNGERKLSKMETIAEENADGSKLSVREILKRFEELRTQNELQMQEGDKGNNEKTLTTIQETLRKLDEKVKSYQIEKKSFHKPIIHQENHVSQITKTIQSQSNHSAAQSVQPSQTNQANHHNHVTSHLSDSLATSNHTSHANHQNHPQNNLKKPQNQEWRQHEDSARLQEESIYESGPIMNDGKHSLLQYAMLNFRQTTEKFEMLKTADGSISGSLKVIESLKNKKKAKKGKGQQQDGAEWTWKEQVDLVKYSPVPVEQSLLRLDNELSALAVECFLCLMRYMGDQPLPADMSEVKCVYTILMHCHKLEALRDEVYCQLMKQTTNNKSSNPDSCQRGWRLFSIVAAYFTCSEGLRPYLIKYLETAAYDKRRAFHGTATVCLQNLRKTVKYGGRKNVPSVEEIMAISAGRNAKRQIYRLPGGTERVINTKCTTVVQDVIEEMCNVISVRNPHEMDEFSLYCIVDGDAFTMPLARDEYILDVTTELHKNHQVFYLIFCRSVWYYPLRLDAALYIEVVFNQIAPDYLEGLLLVIPGDHLPQEIIYDMAQNAALLHKAADMTHEPTTKEIKYLLPKPALNLREPRPQQWGNMVQQAWSNVQHNTPALCKAQVLEILSKWPLFGSSFFAVKRVPEGKEKGGDHILALNRHGVHFIDLITHETLYHYPYSEVISTRKVKSEEGTLYLDMKCGNLMQQRITRLQTEQAHEISRLIRQYITMEQRMTNAQGASVGFGAR